MDEEEDMKPPKLGAGNSFVGGGDVADDNFQMGESSSSSSIFSLTTLSSNQSSFSSSCLRSRSSSFSKPSWLLSSIADLDEKMKIVALSNNNSRKEEEQEDNKMVGDSFAQRAEAYYRTQPQLLSLLSDLYNGYLSLADRYSQTLAKHHQYDENPSPISAIHFNGKIDYDNNDQEEVFEDEHVVESEAESSISYQNPTNLNNAYVNVDLVVAELVMRMVNFDIIDDELSVVERRWDESSRKIELQRSLLEVLESERVILLNENSRLGYKVAVLGEENKGLMAETIFMKRKAGELARCVLKMREDHRVCMLIRKIEELQGQICNLEKRNKDYCQQIAKRDGLLIHLQHQVNQNRKNGKGNGEVTLEDCFQVDEEVEDEKGVVGKGRTRTVSVGGDKKISKWWGRIKNLDLLQCGPHFNISFC